MISSITLPHCVVVRPTRVRKVFTKFDIQNWDLTQHKYLHGSYVTLLSSKCFCCIQHPRKILQFFVTLVIVMYVIDVTNEKFTWSKSDLALSSCLSCVTWSLALRSSPSRSATRASNWPIVASNSLPMWAVNSKSFSFWGQIKHFPHYNLCSVIVMTTIAMPKWLRPHLVIRTTSIYHAFSQQFDLTS